MDLLDHWELTFLKNRLKLTNLNTDESVEHTEDLLLSFQKAKIFKSGGSYYIVALSQNPNAPKSDPSATSQETYAQYLSNFPWLRALADPKSKAQERPKNNIYEIKIFLIEENLRSIENGQSIHVTKVSKNEFDHQGPDFRLLPISNLGLLDSEGAESGYKGPEVDGSLERVEIVNFGYCEADKRTLFGLVWGGRMWLYLSGYDNLVFRPASASVRLWAGGESRPVWNYGSWLFYTEQLMEGNKSGQVNMKWVKFNRKRFLEYYENRHDKWNTEYGGLEKLLLRDMSEVFERSEIDQAALKNLRTVKVWDFDGSMLLALASRDSVHFWTVLKLSQEKYKLVKSWLSE